MKRILPLLLILLLILTGCSAKNADSPAADAPTDTPLTGTSYVQIDVKTTARLSRRCTPTPHPSPSRTSFPSWTAASTTA